MDGPRASSLGELRPDDPTRIGRYRIEAKIGEGGMGAVYLGRDEAGRPVAVKVVRAELAGDRTFLARFHDEAANAQRVASFCTAQVLEHGEDLGLAYMVTEYIDGPSLLEHVAEKGALSPGMLHGVAVGVAAALVAIHSTGLVHRDLKPSNVLLSISGPRVIDFGIARALDTASAHTRTGQVVGTPGWIAPEQITTQQVTPAVDVFAWGCLVAYAASGRNPFGQGSFQILAARAVHAEPETGDLPPSLSGLVQAALRKDPATRPSARDLLLALVGGAGEAAVTTELGETWAAPPGGGGPGVTSLDTPAAPQPRTQAQPQAHAQAQTAHAGAGPPTEHEYASVLPPVPVLPPVRRDGRPSRRTGVIAASVAGVLVAGAVAGGVYVLTRPSGGAGGAGTRAGGLPQDPMLVRVDTAPGWPKSCRADIGVLAPGGSLRTLAGGSSCDILPERSPDRSRIAFTRTGAGGSEAWVMDADGGNPRKVTDIAGGRTTWSPDGTRIAYMGRQGGTKQIFAITLKDHKVTQLTTDDSVKDDPMWSSTGRLAFWSKRDGVEEIYTLDPSRPGGGAAQLTNDAVRSVDPEWSPDGSKIAFSRGPSGSSTIWVVSIDGSGLRPLTSGGDHDMDPAWSRNGRWVCYVRGPLTDPVVRAVRADGTGDRVLTPAGRVLGHPSWS